MDIEKPADDALGPTTPLVRTQRAYLIEFSATASARSGPAPLASEIIELPERGQLVGGAERPGFGVHKRRSGLQSQLRVMGKKHVDPFHRAT
mgnify:CR=1 FL=1